MADPTGCGESTPCNRNPHLPFYTGFYPAPPRPVMRCAIDGGGCTPFRSGAASACRRWPSTCCSAGSGGLRLRGCLLGRFLGLHLHTMITVTAHGARGNRGPASGVQQAVDYTTQGRSGCVERMVALRSEHGSPGSMTVFARGAGGDGPPSSPQRCIPVWPPQAAHTSRRPHSLSQDTAVFLYN